MVLFHYAENNRNDGKEGAHIMTFKVVTGFEGYFIHPGLHIIGLRIKRLDTAIGIRFTAGDMLPAAALLLIELNLHPLRRQTGLLIENMYA